MSTSYEECGAVKECLIKEQYEIYLLTCGGHKIAPKQVPTVADGSLQSLKSRLCWVFVFFYGIGMLLEVLRILLGELDPSFPRLLISLDSISTCTCSIVVLVEILDFGKGLAYKVGGKFLKKEGWRAHSQTGLTYRRNSDAHYRFLVGFCPVGCGALVTGRTYRFLAPPADTFTLSLSLSLSLAASFFGSRCSFPRFFLSLRLCTCSAAGPPSCLSCRLSLRFYLCSCSSLPCSTLFCCLAGSHHGGVRDERSKK